MSAPGFSPYSITKDNEIKKEIKLLWSHWRCFTANTQALFASLLRKLLKDNEGRFNRDNLPILQDLLGDREEDELISKDESSKDAIFVFFKILKLNHLKEYYMQNLHAKIESLVIKQKPEHGSYKPRTFQPINALHPSLKHYYLMSRCYSDRIPFEEEPQESKFYQPPRLLIRGEELWEAQGRSFSSGNKGVLLLTVEGTHIKAGKGMVVSNGSSIEWWMTKSKEYRGLVGEEEVMVEEGKENQVVQTKVNNTRPDNSPTQLHLEYKFIGHEGNITALDLSEDELFVLSAASDKIIKLWCLRTKMLLLHFKNHSSIIWSLKFSHSGFFFLSSSADKSIKMWRTDIPAPIRVFAGHKADVYKAQFMKNPDFVVSASADKTLRIWGVESAQNIRTIKLEREVINFTLSFSGRYVVSCEINGMMTLLDLVKGEEINVINLFYLKKSGEQGEKQRYPIHDMSFSPDEEAFACISKKEIAIYSMQAMKEKISTDIYEDIKGQRSLSSKGREYHVKPKEVLDIGTQMNLLYCRYLTKNYLMVVGKK